MSSSVKNTSTIQRRPELWEHILIQPWQKQGTLPCTARFFACIFPPWGLFSSHLIRSVRTQPSFQRTWSKIVARRVQRRHVLVVMARTRNWLSFHRAFTANRRGFLNRVHNRWFENLKWNNKKQRSANSASRASSVLSSWVWRRKRGSDWIASILWSRRNPTFWTSQSCSLSSNWFSSASIRLLINRWSELNSLYQTHDY